MDKTDKIPVFRRGKTLYASRRKLRAYFQLDDLPTSPEHPDLLKGARAMSQALDGVVTTAQIYHMASGNEEAAFASEKAA